MFRLLGLLPKFVTCVSDAARTGPAITKADTRTAVAQAAFRSRFIGDRSLLAPKRDGLQARRTEPSSARVPRPAWGPMVRPWVAQRPGVVAPPYVPAVRSPCR